jgi:hypothetical protein
MVTSHPRQEGLFSSDQVSDPQHLLVAVSLGDPPVLHLYVSSMALPMAAVLQLHLPSSGHIPDPLFEDNNIKPFL